VPRGCVERQPRIPRWTPGVAVNSILPTAIEGAGVFTSGVAGEVREFVQLFRPMQRMAKVEDVANRLSTSRVISAAFVSGQHLIVTGGRSRLARCGEEVMTVDGYEVGAPCCIALTCDQPATTAAFYSSLFGWQVPSSAGSDERECLLEGLQVSAIGSTTRELRPRLANVGERGRGRRGGQ
jgi:hypothetical protein